MGKLHLRLEVVENAFLPSRFLQDVDSHNVLEIFQEILQSKKLEKQIKYGEWTKIAEYKLNMPSVVAQTLFQIFENLMIDRPEISLERSRKERKSMQNGEHQQFLENRTVHRERFFLFVWLHCYFVGNTFESKQEFTGHISCDKIQKALLHVHNPNYYDNLLFFVRNGVLDMLQLFADSSEMISREQVDNLSLLFGNDENRSVSDILGLWIDEVETQESISDVERALRKLIDLNGDRYPHTLKPTLSENYICTLEHETVKQYNENAIASELTSVGFNFKAQVYLLKTLQHVSVFGNSNSTIVLGSVSGILRVDSCERTAVIATAKCIIVSNCHDCTIYLSTNSYPIILDDCRNVKIAPFNTAYSELALHMNEAGVYKRLNLFTDVVQLGAGECFELLSAEKFSYYTIPFVEKCVSACPLPGTYAVCLERRMKNMALVMSKIRKHRDDELVCEKLKIFLNERFQEWMKARDHSYYHLDLSDITEIEL